MDYLNNFGLDTNDINTIKENVSDDVFSDLTAFRKIVEKNIEFLKEFGVTNFKDVVIKYPEIFLRDAESFRNVFTKFDKDDLISKVEKNPAVIKKMVEFVDKN